MGRENFGSINCDRARQIDMVDFLSAMGIEPVRIRGNDFWYFSPLRIEQTPSFKINRKLNRWYDFGEGAGGNLIDFAIRLHNCSVADFLSMLRNGTFTIPAQRNFTIIDEPDHSIEVLSEHAIHSPALLDYLTWRKIGYRTAEKYCRQVHYLNGQKEYYAIGYKNRSGGYELRSRSFKGCCAPKDFTLHNLGYVEISVFEGFFNMLSYHELTMEDTGRDLLVLNGLSLFERALSVMLSYDQVHLYLDNDRAGDNCCLYAKAISEKFIDHRKAYGLHNDLNDMLNLKYREH